MAESSSEHAIQAFEALSGLGVCVHDVSGAFAGALAPGRDRHRAGCCEAVKSSPTGARCIAFEVAELRRDLGRFPQGRIHRCHAGLVEWVAPVVGPRDLLAILFAGQRRAGPDLRLDVDDLARPRWGRLPAVSQAQAAVILEALRQLAARLATLAADTVVPVADRGLAIRRFIAQGHRGPLRLGQLAHHLGLSAGRTAHAVREATGCPWSGLLNRERLATACRLLRDSDLTVEGVAAASGFRDPSLFHRVFRREYGLTPGVWRRWHGT